MIHILDPGSKLQISSSLYPKNTGARKNNPKHPVSEPGLVRSIGRLAGREAENDDSPTGGGRKQEKRKIKGQKKEKDGK